MGGPKNQTSREELCALFLTPEPLKRMCFRLRVSPNTLRAIWRKEFGSEALKERGRKTQAEAASVVGKTRTISRKHHTVGFSCTRCASTVELKTVKAKKTRAETFVCRECLNEVVCPVCQWHGATERGLWKHFSSKSSDPSHIAWQQEQENLKWQGLRQDLDFVVCRFPGCGHRAKSLVGHIPAVHGTMCEAYRQRFGADAPFWASRTKETRTAASNLTRSIYGSGKGGTKTVICPDCDVSWVGSKFLVPGTHDLRCSDCKEKADKGRWDGMVENVDFVCCQVCNYKAESLVSHLQNAHPELIGCYCDKYPGFLITTSKSSVRGKTDVHDAQRKQVRSFVATHGKFLDLQTGDFEPFLDAEGFLDRKKMVQERVLCHRTVTVYAKKLGIPLTDKHLQQRHKDLRKEFPPEAFEPYKIKNGKVSIGRAAAGLGINPLTAQRLCKRLALPVCSRTITQAILMRKISVLLGGVTYREEWNSDQFKNPKTGRRFRFDGFFKDFGLVVEFHGEQHFVFPSRYIKDEKQYAYLQWKDAEKKKMIEAAPGFKYLAVRADEPYKELPFLLAKLTEAGLVKQTS